MKVHLTYYRAGVPGRENQIPYLVLFPYQMASVFSCSLVLGGFLNFKIQSLQRIVCTSRFSNLQNDHIYHFHASESLNLIFLKFGWGANYYLLFKYGG